MARRLSPIDIQHAEFTRSLNGFDRKEVRAFLERISVEVEGSLRELQALQQKLTEAQARMTELKAAEAELQRAVVAAERISSDMKENARREALLLLEEAERERSERLRQGDQALQRSQAELARLQHERSLFKEQFRGLLQAYLASLDTVPPATPGAQQAPRSQAASGALLDDTTLP